MNGAKDSVKLLPCPFCGKNVDAPFDNLRDDEDGPVPCFTIRHDCAVLMMAVWSDGNSAADCAKAWNTRAAPPAAPAQSNGDEEFLLERLDDQGLYSKAERIQMIKDAAAEIRSLRAQIATAQATYLQFCKKHDEEKAKLREPSDRRRRQHFAIS